MATLPQLLEQDIEVLNQALWELLVRCEASLAMVIDRGGFLITRCGEEPPGTDVTTLAALSAASFAATQGIASLVSETNFTSVYQQGDHFSLLVLLVDDYSLLTVVFRAHLSVGAVKYYATAVTAQIARQLKLAHERAPTQGLDLSLADIADTSGLFRRRVA